MATIFSDRRYRLALLPCDVTSWNTALPLLCNSSVSLLRVVCNLRLIPGFNSVASSVYDMIY